MDQSYWVFEFIKVLLTYMFIMYLWPSVVFRKHLCRKSRAYRFCFCVNISILVINTGVLTLGLIHLLNQVVVAIVFWAVFAIQLFRNYDLGLSRFKNIRKVLNRTMSFRRMFYKLNGFYIVKLRASISRWWSSTKGRRFEYAVLILIVAFATAYFSVNALQVHSYGFGDQYVHHAWVYGLSTGKIFSAGIYPEGMHCVIYLTGTVFPIDFYSIVLFLAGVHIQVYIVSAYLLSRQLFGWRMSGMLALMGFLTIEQVVVNGVFGISRLSWTLPQEFALYAVFMGSYALIGYLRQKPKRSKERFRPFKLSSWRRYFSDRYLFIFITTIAASICVHFYATIIAAFVCVVIAAIYFYRLFRRGMFLRLAVGALIALIIAAAPMVGAFAEGYPLQGSLYWAMLVTNESAEQLDSSANTKKDDKKTEVEATTADTTKASEKATAPAEKKQEAENLSLKERIKDKLYEIIKGSYLELYGKQRGKYLLLVNIGVAGFSIIILLFHGSIDLIRKLMKKGRARFPIRAPESYLIIAVSVFVLLMAYKPKPLGLPSLVAGTRVCSTIDMFTMLLFACAFDILFSLLRPLLRERFLKPLSAAVCVGIYVIARVTGLFHGYLYYELTRYPVAVELAKEIVEHVPDFKYTIISTTDELYQVIENGYHEEWIDFLEKRSKATYTIPTPYMFFFIEKHPIRYAQNNFASGPEWLADEKYVELYRGTGAQYPYILHGQISEEDAKKPLSYGKKRSDTASSLEKRIILESKAYEWFTEFSEIYPNDGEVIYEDEDYICYCVHQNEFSLFSLGIMKN